MKHIMDKTSDTFILIVCCVLALIALLLYVPTTRAQNVYKISKTTIIVKTDTQHAKQDTVATQYKIILDDKVYPVYMNVKSGSMFIVRTSQKTGKQYRCYTIKGKKIKDLFK